MFPDLRRAKAAITLHDESEKAPDGRADETVLLLGYWAAAATARSPIVGNSDFSSTQVIQLRKRADIHSTQYAPLRRSAFSLIELMLAVSLIAVLTAIALPYFQGARRLANENSALSYLRKFTTANEQYRIRFGVFADSETNLINERYMYEGQGPSRYETNYAVNGLTWRLNADPQMPGFDGDRYFFVDHTSVIRFDTAGSATSASTALD